MSKIHEEINLLVTIDEKYITPLLTMMHSYARFHEDIHTRLFIIHRTLSEENLKQIKDDLKNSNIEVIGTKIENSFFEGIPLLERIPVESFDRILAFKYLPEDIDKCLYLDPDILINKSILPLYDMNLDGYYIAAATHINCVINLINRIRLLMKDAKTYVNSGVVLMNLKQMRSDFKIEEIQKLLKKFARVLFLGDQDMINVLYGSKCIVLDDAIYNLDEKAYSRHVHRDNFNLERVKAETIFIHYNGKFKPWLKGYHGELDVLYPEVKDKGPAPRGMMFKQFTSSLKILWPSAKYFVIDLLLLIGIIAIIALIVSLFI